MGKKLLLRLLILFISLPLFAQQTNTNIPVSDIEYQALVDFYKAMGESNWSNKWNTKENNLHEVAWYGVTTENGHITAINLNNTSNITGIIPASFGNLKHLKSLSLYGRDYPKDLSNSDLGVLSDLENLEFLDLRYCKLKGAIPSSWSKLKKLNALHLSQNTISSLPKEFGEIENLVTLDLSYNQLEILPVSMGNLSQLVTLNLSYNQLEVLPKEFENLNALKTLYLNDNKISDIKGFLKNQVIIGLTRQRINIDELIYKGVDVKINALPNIVHYSRAKNDFSARNQFAVYVRGSQIGNYLAVAQDGSLTIPSSYFATLKTGDEVFLYQRSGDTDYTYVYFTTVKVEQPKIPDVEYQALVDFYTVMGGNSWNNKWNTNENNLHEGPWNGISIENGHITAINLNNNTNIKGAIPASFGNLKYLKSLSLYGRDYPKDLSNSDLGVLSDLENLEFLDLRYCKLKGAIPSSWSKLKKLNALHLSQNTISSLPEEFGEIENLVTLDLSYNQLEILPVSMGNLSQLVTLNLSYNQLEVLPKEFENLNALKTLYLNDNKISDIKGFLKNQVSIGLTRQRINIDELIYKGVDVKINALPNIVHYSRAKNDFSARNQFTVYLRGSQIGNNLTVAQDGTLTIPSSYFATLKTGDEVFLYQRSGDTDYTYVYFTTVKVEQPKIPDVEYQALVDFYTVMGGNSWNNKWNTNENNLHEGPWNGISIENGHITAINLNNNTNIKGAIPASFGNLKYLKSLSLYGRDYPKDLSNSDLGVLSDLENLEFLDLRYCKLKGAIPSSWSKLKKLNALHLSQNTISSLPEEFGEIENLVTLDLSYNQLEILPVSMGNLSQLVTLNLSYNQLEVLPKEFENLNALKTLYLNDNKISDIKGFLKNQVSIGLTRQRINIDELIYKGVDVKINALPNIVHYSRAKNDFSARNQFTVYLRGSQIGNNLTVAQDGTLTIPSSYFATLKTGDEVFLYQRSGDTDYTYVYFTTVKVEQPKIPDVEYQALVDFYTVMGGNSWNNKWNTNENNLHEGPWNGISIENGHITAINLNNNTNIKGAIPASFGNLKYLKSLSLYGRDYPKDLSNSDLGVLSDLENLEFLDLRYCKLKGAIPSSWSKLKKLNALHLSQNTISSLPEEFGEIENLVTLDLSYNQLEILPVSMGNLSQLVTLNLSYNQLEVLPKEFENLNALKTLYLNDNKISDIKGFLKNQVSIGLTRQRINIDELVYEGVDVKINTLPNIVHYSRAKNDFSARNQFTVYLRGSQIGNNLTVAQDGSLTIPSAYLATLKTGDEVFLYQRSGDTDYNYVYFTTVKVDQPKVSDIEYQALVDFYNVMGGSKWGSNKWDTSINNLHEGPWYGVSIQNGHITGINLNNTYASGAIPASFGNLKFLKSLSLYGASYTKDLSTTDLKIISELESLEYLDMRACKLTGVIPSSWGKLKDLKTLYLSSNTIQDADEALAGLPLLKTVDIRSQTITIPTIEVGANELIIDLPTLSTMVFDANKGGSINNTNYFTLYINGVNKASNYSNKEGKLIFKDIALLGIKLTDQIKITQNDGAAQATTINYTTVTFGKPLVDEEFEILKKFYTSTNGEQWTKKWDITQNKLHEVSWYGVGTKEGHVVSLNLAENNLSGTLPEELSGLKHLETLNLQSNTIGGSIPVNLGQLTALKTIYLQANKLEGKLPAMSGITGLKKFSIAYNQFKGTIPAQFNNFQNIEQLDLSNNGFDRLETVFTYNLDNVFLNVRNQTITKDEYLYLKGDEISIELPSISTYNEINQDYNGKYLFALQANNFKIAEATPEGNTLVFSNITIADIPAGAKITIWQRTGASQGTYLHYNGIADGSETPLIAEEYQALIAFFEQAGGANWIAPWDITTNNLHEKRWKGITTNDGHIVAINLTDNNLTGSISSELGKFKELQTLNLSHNKLAGSIPKELSQLTKLKTIDLSENELTDMSTTFPANVNFKLDRQKIDLGELPLTLNTLIKDKKINHYDHTNVQFSTNQSYNMTVKDNYKMVTVPEEGFKLMNVMSEWNIPNNQTLEMRQIAGSARNSVLTYTLTYREGDSNLDGIINILDIQSSLNYILNQKPKYFNYGAADINKDKNLNLLDIILLINKIQEGTLEKTASTKRLMASNDEKALLSIEDGVLYIDNPTESTAAFDIRLKGANKEQVKELLSSKGYTMSVSEKGEEISLVGFSMSETLSGKQAIAKVSPKTAIVSAMISNDTATEVPYKIVNATLGIDDIDATAEKTSGVINYPNPFREQTTIQYQLLENTTQAVLKVYNMQGQLVRMQSDLAISEGSHQVPFLRQELPSGVYLYTIEIQASKSSKMYKGKMLIQ